MDTNGRLQTRRVLAALVAAVLASGCAEQVQYVGPAEIRMQEETRTTIAQSTILRDGEAVGLLRTMRVSGPSGDRTVHQVQDNYRNALGYIDEGDCAFRFSAHAGAELVGNSSDRRRNVAAILGAFNSQIDLVLVEPAPASDYQRAPVLPR